MTMSIGTGGLRAYFLSWNDKGNAGAKPAKCTSASQLIKHELGIVLYLF
jgi:hypothetical protein